MKLYCYTLVTITYDVLLVFLIRTIISTTISTTNAFTTTTTTTTTINTVSSSSSSRRRYTNNNKLLRNNNNNNNMDSSSLDQSKEKTTTEQVLLSHEESTITTTTDTTTTTTTSRTTSVVAFNQVISNNNDSNSDDDDNNNNNDDITSTTTLLYGIRHGRSVSNEWMKKEPNIWGHPLYNDNNGNIRDAPLSIYGIEQTKQLQKQLEQTNVKFDLILVSPLTRCIQTYQYGVLPIYTNIPAIIHPLLTERVYTISETGSPKSILLQEFDDLINNHEHIDWSYIPDNDDNDIWWYDPNIITEYNKDIQWYEWRPCDGQQQYLAYGEPIEVFHNRMEKLKQYIQQLQQQNHNKQRILLVAHWGVLRHLTNGKETKNCQLVPLAIR